MSALRLLKALGKEIQPVIDTCIVLQLVNRDESAAGTLRGYQVFSFLLSASQGLELFVPKARTKRLGTVRHQKGYLDFGEVTNLRFKC